MIKLCLLALAEELYLSLMPLSLLTREQLKRVALGSEYECARAASTRSLKAQEMLDTNPLAVLSWSTLMDRRDNVERAMQYAEGSSNPVLKKAVRSAYEMTADEIARRQWS